MPFFFFFFFLALILSCLTFLWSYSVLPFSVRRFEGKEAQYAEGKKKKKSFTVSDGLPLSWDRAPVSESEMRGKVE